MTGSSYACSTRPCSRAPTTLSLYSGSAPIRMDCSGMSKGLSPPERRVDLALPWSRQPVGEWVGDPANSSVAHRRRTYPIQHQVIYASHVPQLSGLSLLEKHRSAHLGTAVAITWAERTSALGGRPAAPARLRHGASGRRSFRWQVLLLATVILSLSTPVF